MFNLSHVGNKVVQQTMRTYGTYMYQVGKVGKVGTGRVPYMSKL